VSDLTGPDQMKGRKPRPAVKSGQHEVFEGRGLLRSSGLARLGRRQKQGDIDLSATAAIHSYECVA
jgi:hypothetical protein